MFICNFVSRIMRCPAYITQRSIPAFFISLNPFTNCFRGCHKHLSRWFDTMFQRCETIGNLICFGSCHSHQSLFPWGTSLLPVEDAPLPKISPCLPFLNSFLRPHFLPFPITHLLQPSQGGTMFVPQIKKIKNILDIIWKKSENYHSISQHVEEIMANQPRGVFALQTGLIFGLQSSWC